MVEVLFWLSLMFVFYVYFGYPLLLLAWAHWAPCAVRKSPYEPSVTLVMAAHNEKDNIRHKIRNCLALDYPRELLQIIVSLDGPTDGTEILALGFTNQGVQLLYTPKHKGKAAAINNAVARARGAILLFVDARQTLESGVIRELASNFSDPSVGAVSGELILVDQHNREAANGVGLYWRYEKFIRITESRIHSAIGATGAIYAIRRDLVQPLPEESILDDVILPMNIVLAGGRVVFDPRARAFDRVEDKPEIEFGRKVRTLAGNFQLLVLMPQLLNPWKNPVFIQFVSHKVARLFIPYALIILFVSNLLLVRHTYRDFGPYTIFFLAQALWYCLALAGYLISAAHPARQWTDPATTQKLEERT